MAAPAALETYLAGVDPAGAPLVIALDEAIRTAGADLDVAVKYKILMYALHSDWRYWVCAIDARRDRVSLRFLYGVLLSDPRHVLRQGSSVLMSWDFAIGEAVDAAAVGSYVEEAVARYPEYRANSSQILEAARQRAASSGRSKGRA